MLGKNFGWIIFLFPSESETFAKRRKKMKGFSKTERQELIKKTALGPKSKELLLRANEVESYANLYNFIFEDAPPVIVKGKGSIVWDADGNKYIDLISGFAVSNVGHCHPRVIQKVTDQCNIMFQYAEMPSEARVKLAEKLIEITPGHYKKKVFYTVTGGEAVEFSLKAARYYTNRPSVMGFRGAYHGRTFMASTVSCNAYMRYFQGFPLDVGVIHLPYAYCYRCPFGREADNCDMECTKYIEEHFKCNWYGVKYEGKDVEINNVAAMIVEPMQGSSGYITPPDQFLQDLRRITEENNILLIVDEIQTGWGRTGMMWGCEHSNVEPDIMTVSKSIAGGLPLSATIATEEIMDELGPAAHTTTFAGYNLACEVALEVIDIFEKEKLVEKTAKSGEYFYKALEDLMQEHALIGNIEGKGKGLFIGVELVEDRNTKKPAVQENIAIQNECLKKGVLFERGGWYGNMMKLIPPLVITKEEIDRVIEVFDAALKVAEK